MRQLTARDAAYLYLGDTHRTATIVSCWALAEPAGAPARMTVEQVVERMTAVAASVDVFASVLVRLPFDIDLPYWRLDPRFDARDHIVFHRDVSDWVTARDRLMEIGARPFDRSRPLWRIEVLLDVRGMPGRSGCTTIVAFMYHHAAFDGVTFAHLANTFFGDVSSPWPYDPSQGTVGPGSTSRARLTARAVLRQPIIWGRFGREVSRAVIGGRDPGAPPAGPVTRPPTAFGGLARGARCVDQAVFTLAEVKAIKRKVAGATLNDVMLSVIGGAMVAYLTEIGHPPTRSLISLVPVSTRGVDQGDAANQFAPALIDMHTDEPRPDLRIAAIARSSAAAKDAILRSDRGRGVDALHAMPAVLIRVIGAVARWAGRLMPSSGRVPADTVVTNVFSPYVSESVLGMSVVGGLGMQTLDSPTLAHAVSSLGEQLLVSLTADSTVLGDSAPYVAAIVASFAEHQRILQGVSDEQ